MNAILLLQLAAAAVAPAKDADIWRTGVPPDTESTRIHVMEVDIWPEYDDPRVLVMYRGEVDANAELPREFAFVIPRGAQIHMAGAIGEQGEHLHAQFVTKPQDETLTEVSYELATRTFYMEFYYDPLPKGERREFRYPIRSPYPIDFLSIRVQQPSRASEFRIAPTALDVVQGANGLNYHRLVWQQLPADRETPVTVSYRKRDREPSVSPAGAAAPTGGSAMKNILIIGAVLLVGVVGYGVLLGRTRRLSPSRNSVPTRAPSGPTAPGPARQQGQYKYCVSCGHQMLPPDKFCAACGTQAARS